MTWPIWSFSSFFVPILLLTNYKGGFRLLIRRKVNYSRFTGSEKDSYAVVGMMLEKQEHLASFTLSLLVLSGLFALCISLYLFNQSRTAGSCLVGLIFYLHVLCYVILRHIQLWLCTDEGLRAL